jgi:hypothetical protein
VRWTAIGFGVVEVDGKVYRRDLVADGGVVVRRRKKPSKKYRQLYGHTPLSLAEAIPWRCRRLIVGIGFEGALPVLHEVRQEALRRRVELVLLPTPEAVLELNRAGRDTNAIVHVTC